MSKQYPQPEIVTKVPKKSPYEGLTMTLPSGESFHLGYSRLSSYLGCPKAYKFSYVDKIRSKPTMPILRGQAYHGVVETLLQWKIENPGRRINPLKVEKLSIAMCEREGLKGKEIDKMIQAVEFYCDNKFKLHKPMLVETDFAVARGGVKITGRIDLVETVGLVTDHKMSSDVWPKARAQYGCQPIIYQWAGIDVIQKNHPGWKFEAFEYNIIRIWPTPKIQTIRVNRLSQEQSDWWEESIFEAAKAIRKGFFPAIPSEKSCAWCFHKKICNPTIYDLDITATGEDDDDDTDY